MFAGTLEYLVKPGDSLSLIATKYGRPPTDWKKIFDLNTDQIKNPDLIQPGQILKVPVDWDGGQLTTETKKAGMGNFLIWAGIAGMAWYLWQRRAK